VTAKFKTHTNQEQKLESLFQSLHDNPSSAVIRCTGKV
jgi:hypothetical protein